MIAISTVYWRDEKNGAFILDEVKRFGFQAIEISNSVTKPLLGEILPALREHSISTTSVHNYCPTFTPRLLPGEEARPEPLFSSSDAEERGVALELSQRTLELAADLEAKAVVLHLGTTSLEPPNKLLKDLFDRDRIETQEGVEKISEIKAERARAGEAVKDAVYFSLEALTGQAEALGILLGIENRIYLEDYPTYEETAQILKDFDGGNFGYWHDVGHGTVHENLGLARMAEVLPVLGPHLIGLHIHDAKGYADHIAPGQGDSDYDLLASHLSPDTLRVLEVHRQAKEEEVLDGIALLREKGIF